MVADLGFEIVIGDHEAYLAWKATQTQNETCCEKGEPISCHG